MSVIFIENYRGKDIFYSPSQEKFFADIDDPKEKNLIHLVRKDIDDYIKLNMNFRPFVAFKSDSFDRNFDNPIFKTVTGLRKDRTLQCEDGSKISNYDLNDFHSCSPCNWFKLNEETKDACLLGIEQENKEISILEEKIKFHKDKIKEFVDKMKGENLADFRRRITGEKE